ncbi:SusC/RagA family TonB-linked outer membrane protein [Flexithrix dorotheae]|uniref:SusC/RagA family TonB-linked outer membrane protein n=1 Tax=Flexithrix dorotheae TaxID=70993 RepID=UPI000372809B|nr:TonB-dependent receptor [Flexithrix dorotheae]
MKRNLLLIISLLLYQFSYAQDIQISGTVTSAEDQEPLPGVSILLKGTNTGTTTDFDGNFRLSVPPDGTLQVSFIGFETHEEAVNNRSIINIALTPDIEQLEEVVVVGYGTKKKTDVLGSVATVKSEDLLKIPAPSFDQSLQGMATGVQVSTSSGVPGAPVTVKIRGISSINSGTNPLWIVDGMPIYSGGGVSNNPGGGLEKSDGTTGQNPMSMINPNDIESIEVLKDAAATAIYGSRGSNGVIIITTKTGKAGQSSLNIDYSIGVSDLSRDQNDIGYVTTKEYMQLADMAIQNSSGNPNDRFEPRRVLDLRPTFSPLTREEADLISTDWFNEALRKGSFQELNLSATKGFEKGSMYLSLGYRDDKSVNRNNDLQRLSTRINLDFEPVKNLKTGMKLNFTYTVNDRIKSSKSGAFGSGGGGVGGFGTANRGALPWLPVLDASEESNYWSPASGVNLRANIDRALFKDQVQQYRVLGGFFAEYNLDFVKGLSIRTEISGDMIQNNSETWTSALLKEDASSYAFDRAATFQSYNYNLYAKYYRTFGDHTVSATFGTESTGQNQQIRNLEGRDLVGSFQELGNPATRLSMTSFMGNERYLRAFFGRADYKLKDKYLVGVSLRRDGSSKFDSDFRWGTFTAFSAGWILTEEAFLQDQGFISLLKLRGSYGQTGNEAIPNGLTVTKYTNNSKDRYGYENLINAGTRVDNIGNPFLTWETTNSYDAGVDFGLFENRINGSVAYYQQYVDDLLLAAKIPTSTGLSGESEFWDNIGDMKNEGVEFELHSININKGGFKWTTDFNISTNSNEVVKLTPDLDRAGGGLIKDNKIYRTGGKLNAYFMAEYAGIDPDKGVEMIYEIDIENYNATGNTVKTGRLIPATLDNVTRHRIIHNDKTPIPTYFGGFNNVFSFKGFDLSVLFTFSGGDYIYDYNRQRASFVHNGQTRFLQDMIGNTWQQPGDNASYPIQTWGSTYEWGWDPNANNGAGDWKNEPGAGNYSPESRFYSRFLYKADYVRLRNVQLAYNLPSKVINKIGIQGMRVFVSGTNLWLSSKYPGYDPESANWIDTVPVPQLKTFTTGVSLKL